MIADADGNRGRFSGGNQRGGGRDDSDWWPICYLDLLLAQHRQLHTKSEQEQKVPELST